MTSFGGALVFPANAGTGAAVLPKGYLNAKAKFSRAQSDVNGNSGAVSGASMFASLSDASNEVLVRGADAAFLVADVDTLPGDGRYQEER